jgi:U3 small nucleolar RNA-associated protein 12
VRLWDLQSSECTVTLKGHKSSVTALRFNKSGSLLASGSKDTDLIVWDVVAETGLYRLRGHRDQVTDLAFLDRGNRLISSSKDGFVKCWNLTSQHCEQTLSGHKAEIWSLDINPSETRLVTGSTDHEIRVYSIHPLEDTLEPEEDGSESKKRRNIIECLQPMGSIKRSSGDRVGRLRYDETGGLLACQGGGKSLELFRVRGESEAKKKLKRRKKRRKEKLSKKEEATAAGNQEPQQALEEDSDELRASDELESLQVITCKSKVKSFAFAPNSAVLLATKLLSGSEGDKGGASEKKECLARLALSLSNNTLEVVDVLAPSGSLSQDMDSTLQPSDLSLDTSRRIEHSGHRTDIRCLALSWDDQLLASASNSHLKVWRPHTGACLSTIDSGYGLSLMFVPGNNYLVLGTKEGTIEVFDVGAAIKVHTEEAHAGPIWSLCMLPDKTGFVSGSADKEVKFWLWQVVVSKEDGTKTLRLKHSRTLKMADDVLCVRISPDARLLAVSLLDATIKVFYLDTLKFFLSLYGHKLPVLCMDISSDSTLLVSGSADKNIKIWGLDFGDCHKSLFAHGDTVMQVSFVYNTHYCFTVGKDRLLKYWDLDRNEMLLELSGHHGEVWALAVSAYGDFVVTGERCRGRSIDHSTIQFLAYDESSE